MENPKESTNPICKFFKVKYRIVPVYKGYKQIAVLVQKKHWWACGVWWDCWSHIMQDGEVKTDSTATFENVDDALAFIKSRKTIY